MFLMIFDFFECEVMYLKSACPQCLVKAEGAEDLATWPLVVINHYAGDYEMYIYIYFKGSLGVKLPRIWKDEKQRREE